MVSDVWESMTSYIRDRAVSPLTGALAASWLIWNHRTVIALFSGGSIAVRFGYIDEVIYPTAVEFIFLAIVAPMVSALAYLFLYHKPALFVYRHQLKQRSEMLEARNRAEGARVLTEAEATKLREHTNHAVQSEKQRYLRAEERISELEASNAELQKALGIAQRRLDELRASNAPLPAGNMERDEGMRSLLIRRPWVMHYNPSGGGKKVISFAATGDIFDGQSDNERRWQVRSGRLEILGSAGELYSVFEYSAPSGSFVMVDGEGGVATRNLSGHFIAAT